MPQQPDKSTRLFKAVPAKIQNRLIMRYGGEEDSLYAISYKEAADRLAASFTGEPRDDLILMPFLMLYRQAFELELKILIAQLAGYLRKHRDPSNPKLQREAVQERVFDLGHNLYKLLNEVQKHWKALEINEPLPPAVVKLIIMLHEADTSGTAFRYAGEMPNQEERADFIDLATLLGEQFNMLGAVESFAEARFDAAPEDYYY